MKTIDWNQASDLGLIERINSEILHPLGLAMTRDPDTGISDRLLVSDDGAWEYGPDRVSKILTDEDVRKKLIEILK
jgi:hypothetical protein